MDCLFSYAAHAALVAFPEHRADDIAELHSPNDGMIIVTFDNGDTFYYFCL